MPVFVLYKQQFLLQLLLGEGIFLCRLERKSGFWLRTLLCLAGLLLIAGMLPAGAEGVLRSSAQYLFLFACSLLALWFCFAEPFQNLLFCGIAGYTIQHLSYLIFTVLDEFAFSEIGSIGVPMVDPYGTTGVSLVGLDSLQLTLYLGVYVVIYLTIYFVVYITAFDFFDPVIRSNHNLKLGRVNLICLSGLLIVADVIFNMVTAHYTVESVSKGLEFFYNILMCAMILAMLYSQLFQRELKDELQGIRLVLEQGRRQYEVAKKAADLINIKYHDLRHQSEQMKHRGTLFQGEQEELNQILDAYDVQMQTGSEVLDIILTEKNLLCREQDTQLLCMADGQELSQIKPHHLYALLGNAIDNAMEAVLPLPAEERIISLYLRRQGEMLHIHIENPYAGTVMLRNGMPVTHKEDTNYHGYGMLSMKTIAEQYGGGLSVQAEDGLFSLDAVLMLPASNG